MKNTYTVSCAIVLALIASPVFATQTSSQKIEKGTPQQKHVLVKKTISKKVTIKKPAPKPTPKKKEAVSKIKEFTMTAENWKFSPNVITVKKGDKVRIRITSIDISHGFALSDFGINAKLEPNTPQTIEFTATKIGSFLFRCSVPCGSGHRDMTGTLIVK